MTAVFDVQTLDKVLQNTAWSPIDIVTINDQVVRAACFFW